MDQLIVRMIESSCLKPLLAVVDTEPIDPISTLQLYLVDKQAFQWNDHIWHLVLM